MKKYYFLLIIMLLPLTGFSQIEKKKFGIKFSGFVKNDIIYDTRQTINAREGHFLLYPEKPELDVFGKDINDSPNFNMLSIQTRLHADIYGPDAFGAKTSGAFEGEFFGHSNADINGFRLRHAFIKFNWTNSELLFGQYWNPFFITSCYASTVSFNTGAPFQPFSRNPQVRFTQKLGSFQFIGAALAQRDFTSPGGSSSQRNAVLPNLNAQIHYTKKLSDGVITTGLAVDYKKLMPRLKTKTNYATDNTVEGTSYLYFLKFQVPALTFKFEYVRGQNMFNNMMLGGYAVSKVIDIEKDYREYTPVQVSSYWVDIHSNGKKFQAGVFAGYSANDGTVEENNGTYSTRGKDIAYLYRISPRVVFNSGKAKFALECEYTAAAYLEPGTTIDNHGIIDNSEVVGNIRLLMGVYYFF